MSLLGKILAILNVLAVVGLVCLAAMSYGKRQAWAHAVLRHDLAIDGLPLDDKDTDEDGIPVVDKISDWTRDQMFQPVGGAGVKTQMEELQNVRRKVEQKVEEAPPETKGAVLARILTPLATSGARRYDLAQRAKDPKAPVADLQNDLANAFERATHDESGKELARDAKRQAIAALLFRLAGVIDEDPANPDREALESPYYRRLQVVAGQNAVAREVENHANLVTRMTNDVVMEIERERGEFVADHKKVLLEIQVLAKQLDDRQTILDRQKALTKQHSDVVKQRTQYRDDMKELLAKAREETKQELDKQTAREQAVFASQKELRDSYADILALEVQIRKLEKLVQKLEQTRGEGGSR
jgi:hypothetical protein